ncbi:MAG: hypothetical protein ACTIH2_07895, partial [Anaerococcus sp.]
MKNNKKIIAGALVLALSAGFLVPDTKSSAEEVVDLDSALTNTDTSVTNEPEEKIFYAKYVLKDEDGNLIQDLQTVEWNDWDKMEQGSVATANIFADTYGQWNVEAKA